MTDIQTWLDQGKSFANQIDEGPWTWNADEFYVLGPVKPSRNGQYLAVREHASCNDDLDGEFIADARTRLPQALNALQAVLDLHHKVTRCGNDEYSVSAEVYLESPEDHFGFEPFDLCAECVQVEMDLVEEQSEHPMSIGLRSAWPCPTVRAIQDTIKEAR